MITSTHIAAFNSLRWISVFTHELQVTHCNNTQEHVQEHVFLTCPTNMQHFDKTELNDKAANDLVLAFLWFLLQLEDRTAVSPEVISYHAFLCLFK